jgi:hypothetical protein
VSQHRSASGALTPHDRIAISLAAYAVLAAALPATSTSTRVAPQAGRWLKGGVQAPIAVAFRDARQPA